VFANSFLCDVTPDQTMWSAE